MAAHAAGSMKSELPQPKAKGWRGTARMLLRVIKALFTPVALGFLVYFAWRSRDLLTVVLSEASFLHIVLAVIFWCLLHLLAPLFAMLTLGACGSKVAWRSAFQTHASRLPARYLPGGIWHTVGRIIDYHDLGVRPRHLTAFVLLENGLAAAVTLAIGGSIVFAYRGADSIGVIVGLCAMAGIAALPVLWVVLNRHVLRNTDSLAPAAFAQAIGIMVLFWFTASVSFVLYMTAFSATTMHSTWGELAGVYMFSWGVGFVSVFAPQGIGVFEVVAGDLLEGPMGLMSLAVLIGGFRVVVFAADFAVWAVYQLYQLRTASGSTSKSV